MCHLPALSTEHDYLRQMYRTVARLKAVDFPTKILYYSFIIIIIRYFNIWPQNEKLLCPLSSLLDASLFYYTRRAIQIKLFAWINTWPSF